MRNRWLKRSPFNWLMGFVVVWSVFQPDPNTALAARPGDLATKWPVNDDDPSANIPSVEERNKDPMEFGYSLQDLLARANAAYLATNWPEAVKYYEALAKAVPDVASTWSRLCVAYAKIQRQDVAAAYCAKATTLPGAKVADHLNFLDLTLRKPELTQQDIDAVNASLQHLREHVAQHPQRFPGEPSKPLADSQRPEEKLLMEKLREQIHKDKPQNADRPQPEAEETPELLADKPAANDPNEAKKRSTVYLPTEIELHTCKLASIIGDDERLTSCIAALQQYKLNSQMILPFRWAQALLHKDEAQAEQLMSEVKALGLPSTVSGHMAQEQDRVFGRIRGLWKWLMGIGVLAGAAVYGFTRWRKQKPSGPAAAPPEQATTQA